MRDAKPMPGGPDSYQNRTSQPGNLTRGAAMTDSLQSNSLIFSSAFTLPPHGLPHRFSAASDDAEPEFVRWASENGVKTGPGI